MNRRMIFISGGVVVILLVVVLPLILWVSSRTPAVTTGVQFITVPDDITVQVNDSTFTVDYEDIVALETGTYQASLSADGFNSTTVEIEVVEDTISAVYVYLEPATEEAELKVSSDEMQARIERIGGARINNGAAAIEDEAPFINQLPIIDKYFTAYPCRLANDEGVESIGVCVELAIDEPFYRESALKALADVGITPENTRITFSSN